MPSRLAGVASVVVGGRVAVAAVVGAVVVAGSVVVADLLLAPSEKQPVRAAPMMRSPESEGRFCMMCFSLKKCI